MRDSSRENRGAAAVEFAITLPVVLLLLSAVLDYGWVLHQKSNMVVALKGAARLGAAIYRGSSPGPAMVARTQAMDSLAAMGLPCPGDACQVKADLVSIAGQQALQLDATVDWSPLFGLVPTPTALHVSQTMVLDDQPSSWY